VRVLVYGRDPLYELYISKKMSAVICKRHANHNMHAFRLLIHYILCEMLLCLVSLKVLFFVFLFFFFSYNDSYVPVSIFLICLQ
jgi:hypothetical protein